MKLQIKKCDGSGVCFCVRVCVWFTQLQASCRTMELHNSTNLFSIFCRQQADQSPSRPVRLSGGRVTPPSHPFFFFCFCFIPSSIRSKPDGERNDHSAKFSKINSRRIRCTIAYQHQREGARERETNGASVHHKSGTEQQQSRKEAERKQTLSGAFALSEQQRQDVRRKRRNHTTTQPHNQLVQRIRTKKKK